MSNFTIDAVLSAQCLSQYMDSRMYRYAPIVWFIFLAAKVVNVGWKITLFLKTFLFIFTEHQIANFPK